MKRIKGANSFDQRLTTKSHHEIVQQQHFQQFQQTKNEETASNSTQIDQCLSVVAIEWMPPGSILIYLEYVKERDVRGCVCLTSKYKWAMTVPFRLVSSSPNDFQSTRFHLSNKPMFTIFREFHRLNEGKIKQSILLTCHREKIMSIRPRFGTRGAGGLGFPQLVCVLVNRPLFYK